MILPSVLFFLVLGLHPALNFVTLKGQAFSSNLCWEKKNSMYVGSGPLEKVLNKDKRECIESSQNRD